MSLASSRASIGASTGSDSTFRVGAGADVAGVATTARATKGSRMRAIVSALPVVSSPTWSSDPRL